MRAWAVGAVMVSSACLASPPAALVVDPDAGSEADAAPPVPPVPVELIGDLVTLDCNDDFASTFLIDRSGNGRHGDHGESQAMSGKYGGARAIGDGLPMIVARDGGLGPGAGGLTLEAFVWLDATGPFATLMSDFKTAGEPPLTFELRLQDEASNIALVTNSGAEEISAQSSVVTIPLQTWTHVAATWDGVTVVFYLDGNQVGVTSLARSEVDVPDPRFVHFGERWDTSNPLEGAVDEIKISSYVKSAAQIAASRDFDSTELAGRCGDRVAEGNEVCDGQDLCCAANCQPQVEDAACQAVGGSCRDGACKLPGADRVTSGLIALYTFTDSISSEVEDEIAPAADLTITPAGSAVQGEGFLSLSGGALLRADTPTKLADRMLVSNQLTVEAWVAPANIEQKGPSRIASYSYSVDLRNFTLGQDGSMWVARAVTDSATPNGLPMIGTGTGVARSGGLAHVVLTIAGGERRLYVDGLLKSVGSMPGDFAGWDPGYPLVVGNEVSGDRAWDGDLHLIAIYDRALSEAEVATNFAAGANP